MLTARFGTLKIFIKINVSMCHIIIRLLPKPEQPVQKSVAQEHPYAIPKADLSKV